MQLKSYIYTSSSRIVCTQIVHVHINIKYVIKMQNITNKFINIMNTNRENKFIKKAAPARFIMPFKLSTYWCGKS